MFYKVVALLLLIFLVSACEVVPLTEPPPPTAIPALDAGGVAFAQQLTSDRILNPLKDSVRALRDSLGAFAPAPGWEAAAQALEGTTTPDEAPGAPQPVGGEARSRALPRHGLYIAFLLPMLVVGVPWVVLETFVARYVRPRGIDVTKVLIKAQDGLFIETAVSMTAQKSLTPAAITARWRDVRDFVEKTVEQELIHEALKFSSLESLERNLKGISDSFRGLPIVNELSRDFGVRVLRFNIETRYSQETIDALNRRAEASAGGAAYLAYAAAANLDPNSAECRELYRIYQETSGQVDAARNLGGGISSLAGMLGQRGQSQESEEE